MLPVVLPASLEIVFYSKREGGVSMGWTVDLFPQTCTSKR